MKAILISLLMACASPVTAQPSSLLKASAPTSGFEHPPGRVYPNPLNGTHWMQGGYAAGGMGGLADKGEWQHHYTFHKSAANEHWGTYLQFADSLHFISGNMGPCGNECRQTIHGRYLFLDSNRIMLIRDSIVYWKDCRDRPTERQRIFSGTYEVSMNDSALVLQRSAREYEYHLKTPWQTLKLFLEIVREEDATALMYITTSACYTSLLRQYSAEYLYRIGRHYEGPMQEKRVRILVNKRYRQVWEFTINDGGQSREVIEFAEDAGSNYDLRRWKISNYTHQLR